jgi:mono/diheme cytochrome c family protein
MKTVTRVGGAIAIMIGIVALTFAMTHIVAPHVSSAAPAPMSRDLVRGQQTFLEYCAMCHGDGGEGDGEMAAALQQKAGVRPANLTDRARIARLGRAGVQLVVVHGGAHTGRSNMMPAWGERLSSQQVRDVVDYVSHLPDAAPGVSSTTLRDYTTSPPGAPEDGRRLFLHHCAACHGTQGRGDGPFAMTLNQRHQIRPRNLTDSTYIAQKTDRELFVTVTLGGGHVGKSPYMPSWAGYLAPEQIKSLVSYIRAISHTAPQP